MREAVSLADAFTMHHSKRPSLLSLDHARCSYPASTPSSRVALVCGDARRPEGVSSFFFFFFFFFIFIVFPFSS